MKNNKGVTLVELVVSVAIFAVVSLAVASFLIIGTRLYRNVNDNVQLQYDSQLALNHINEYIVDCQSGFAWDETASTIFAVNSDGTVHVFRYDSASRRILYGSCAAAENVTSAKATEILTENVDSLSVESNVSSGAKVESISLTLTMSRGGKTFKATQVTALRNTPLYGNTWALLWEELGLNN